MIDGRCFACRSWRPIPDAIKPIGTCLRDDQIAHSSYRCHHFRIRHDRLLRCLSVVDGEVDWLREHPRSRWTIALRQALEAIGGQPDFDDPKVTAFLDLLDLWRATELYGDVWPYIAAAHAAADAAAAKSADD